MGTDCLVMQLLIVAQTTLVKPGRNLTYSEVAVSVELEVKGTDLGKRGDIRRGKNDTDVVED